MSITYGFYLFIPREIQDLEACLKEIETAHLIELPKGHPLL